jgi:hypothetical protein
VNSFRDDLGVGEWLAKKKAHANIRERTPCRLEKSETLLNAYYQLLMSEQRTACGEVPRLNANLNIEDNIEHCLFFV